MGNIVETFLLFSLMLFLVGASIPFLRQQLGIIGISICSSSFSIWLSTQVTQVSKVPFISSLLALIAFLLLLEEVICCVAKGVEVLRGSQLAEQLFLQERGGPIEYGASLLVVNFAVSAGSGEWLLEIILKLARAESKVVLDLGQPELSILFGAILILLFPLIALGILFELLSGLLQRVSKKNIFGVELSNLRLLVAILVLVNVLQNPPSIEPFLSLIRIISL
jgi:hypothetical protein